MRNRRRTWRLIEPPIPDPTLAPFWGGLGVLSRDGKFAGNVATVVVQFWSPSSLFRMQWMVLYFVIWQDGMRERSEQDYPSEWLAVNEMKRGYFDAETAGAGRNGRYDFAWVPRIEISSAWSRLGITLDDF